jgi:hypothetical protein
MQVVGEQGQQVGMIEPDYALARFKIGSALRLMISPWRDFPNAIEPFNLPTRSMGIGRPRLCYSMTH